MHRLINAVTYGFEGIIDSSHEVNSSLTGKLQRGRVKRFDVRLTFYLDKLSPE